MCHETDGLQLLFWAWGIYHVYITSGWSLRGIMGVFVTRGHDTDTVIMGSQLDSDSRWSQSLSYLDLLSIVQSRIKSVDKIIMLNSEGPELADWLHILSGYCQHNYQELRGSVKWVAYCSNPPLYGVFWSIQWRQIVLKSPVCHQ